METITQEDWLEYLRERNKGSLKQLCADILERIAGYGIEYGFDEDEDAQDLANAFQALNTLLLEAVKPL